MIVSSFVIATLLANPRVALIYSGELLQFSIEEPTSSLTYFPPVKTAISLSMALRLSPKEGALTAQTLRLFLSRLRIKPANNYPSISSAIISRGFCS